MLKSKKKTKPKVEQRLDKTRTYLGNLKRFEKSTDQTLKDVILKAKTILEKNIEEAKDCVEQNAKTGNAEDLACEDKVKTNYNKSKAAYRLVKYQAIVSGTPKTCVEADLGQKPRLEAKGITSIQEEDKDNPKETGKSALSRLYLCTGKDGKIKWRIFYDRNFLRITPEDTDRLKLTLDLNTLANKSHLEELKKELGI